MCEVKPSGHRQTDRQTSHTGLCGPGCVAGALQGEGWGEKDTELGCLKTPGLQCEKVLIHLAVGLGTLGTLGTLVCLGFL